MEDHPMLAEKFFLTLETLISHTPDSEPDRHPDGSPNVVWRLHVPMKLPDVKPSDQVIESQTLK